MTLMNSLITTTTPSPPTMIVYGQPGVGKTTFAASAGAILIDCENGAGVVPGLTRTPYLQTWPEMRKWLAELASTPPDGVVSVAIDTIDWMVQRIVEHVVVDLDDKSPNDITNTLGTAHGGYFKAREIVQNIVYRDLLPIRMAVGVVIAAAVVIPGIQQQSVMLSLMIALGIVLLISMPLLLLAGATRILGDVTAAAKKVLTT